MIGLPELDPGQVIDVRFEEPRGPQVAIWLVERIFQP